MHTNMSVCALAPRKYSMMLSNFCAGGGGGCGGGGGDLVDLHDFGCEVHINLGIQNLDEF